MRKFILLFTVVVLAAGLALFAQNGNPRGPQGGQGTTPHAYCDKDGDGLCDITGLPVGQCQADCPNGGAGQGRGQGRGQRQGQGGECPNPSCPRNGAGAQRGAPQR
jgi:hypothetical protein